MIIVDNHASLILDETQYMVVYYTRPTQRYPGFQVFFYNYYFTFLNDLITCSIEIFSPGKSVLAKNSVGLNQIVFKCFDVI